MKLPENFVPSEEILLKKLDSLNVELHHLKRANTKLKKEVRAKNKIIADLKGKEKKRQHYKNGKRGTFKNG